MKRLILIAIVFCLQVSAVTAQNSLKGVVVDSAAGNSLPYVNIGIVNSSVGTVANEKGEFTLSLTQEIKSTDTLKFSSVGYQSFSCRVSTWRENDDCGQACKCFYCLKKETSLDRLAQVGDCFVPRNDVKMRYNWIS